MLLPHVLFSAIYHAYKAAWQKIILLSEERLQGFWQLQAQHPALEGHPVLNSTPDLRNKMLPLALHGDGTPVIGIGKIWSRQLTIFSFNSLLGRGVTKEKLFWMTLGASPKNHSQVMPRRMSAANWTPLWGRSCLATFGVIHQEADDSAFRRLHTHDRSQCPTLSTASYSIPTSRLNRQSLDKYIYIYIW